MKEYYKKENLEPLVKKCSSFSEVLRQIGLADKGTNFKTLKKYIDNYGISVEHFSGRTWNKDKSYSEKTSYHSLDDILKENVNFKSNTLKYRLIKEGLKEYKCEQCGCDGYWCGKPITLELHHINGNHYDNRIENLQILCPNCHSQTSTHKRRKKSNTDKPLPFKRKTYICLCKTCGKEFKADRERLFCSRECYNISLRKNKKVECITKEILEQEIKECTTISALAKKLRLSRTSIRKYMDNFNLLDSFKDENNSLHSKPVIQYDFDWNVIKEWASISDAEETLKIHGISKVINKQRISAGGFYWKLNNSQT